MGAVDLADNLMAYCKRNMKNIVILISGYSSNLQAIYAAYKAQNWPARITAVISNNPQSTVIHWASQQGLETQVLDHRAFDEREQFDKALIQVINRYEPDLIVLAGFMRILTADFVVHYKKRIVNIHPSLLPDFPGIHTHQRAIEAGCTHAGATVHWVSADLYHGSILGQVKVPIQCGDTVQRLAERVLQAEHRLYPDIIRQLVVKK